MVEISERTSPAPRSEIDVQTLESYYPGPSIEDVLSGRAMLVRGASGDAVRALQQLLNRAGIQPPLKEDGLFGPKTETAVQQFRGRAGMTPTGSVDQEVWTDLDKEALVDRVLSGVCGRAPNTLPRAPRLGDRPPPGGLSAGALSRDDDLRRNVARARRTNDGGVRQPPPPDANTPRVNVAGAQPVAGQTPADAQLEALQRSTIASAQRELGAGVCADQGPNRGRRVDQYARDAGMPPGGAWCGYFTGFNYNQAARDAGGRFTENVRFHSFEKARAYFEYRNFTNNSRSENERLDRLHDQQTADGSARRWMVLSGSGGQRHAEANHRPCEVYEPNNLPIRAGDTALFSHGHVGLVESYDPNTGRLVTIEGNSQNCRVNRNTYDLNDPKDRAKFDGFGRPARGDFDISNAPAAPTGPAPSVTPSTTTLNLPERDPNAMTGSQFLERTKNMSRADREAAILREIQSGNVPEFARQMRDVQVTSTGPDGTPHTGTVHVMPDYLAIGSNEDFVRIPMDPITAQKIADQTGTSLPTTRIVDETYRQADVKLTPQPLPAGPQMMSNDYYRRHNQLVQDQFTARHGELGQLTAGDQKDLVISNMLTQHPDRVAIYGWHQPNGRPIQPLSTVHEKTYADYSHGVRLVGGTMVVDGIERPIADVLRDPNLAGLVSNEGVIRDPRVPGVR